MKALPQRTVSALVTLLVFAGTYYFFKANGLLFIGLLVALVGSFEYSRMTLLNLDAPKLLTNIFLFICINLFLISLYANENSTWATMLLILYFILCSIWSLHAKFENQKLLSFISFSIVGFFYSVILPSFALKLLIIKNGSLWFLLLLLIVFAGDVFAYFGGILMGKTKIMPTVSPSKTLAGAISGLVGSLCAGLLVQHFLLSEVTVTKMIVTSLLAGVLAQSGDLFESLLKRVARVKDSGQFMPGHGGILDRLDGVYFAAPLIYSLAVSTTY